MEFVLLTGATSSIGTAVAIALSNQYVIILAGRNLDELKLTQSKLEGTGHLIWNCDFLSDNIYDSLTQFLNSNSIKISHFLHLSGWFSIVPIRLQKKQDTLKSFQINVFSAIEIISVLTKKEYKQDLKNILFVSSISSIRGVSGYSVYASAKSALLGLIKSLAIELKPVKVNTIVLGAVRTKATEDIIKENEAFINNQIPLGLASDTVLNSWVLFLLEGKTWMTGQKIIVDGGATVL
jgi:NAD(P)-dependent dehydrogenase (short-subunit alcohol dehydrogenase family)